MQYHLGNMATRKALSKRIRFKVFERDGFICKYCGRNSDAVALEIDHVHPVSKGGGNGMENLITSCFDCNRGKSDKVIDAMPESEHLRLAQERRELERSMKERAKITKLRAKRSQDRADCFCRKVYIDSVNYRFLRAIEALCDEFGDDQAMTWASAAYLKIGEKNTVGSSYHWENACKYLYGTARRVRERSKEDA